MTDLDLGKGAPSAPVPAPWGRERELEHARRIVDDARAGRSGALAFVGEAGIGKTSILEAAISYANEMLILRARGVESETELAFSGLHELFSNTRLVIRRPAALRAALRGRLQEGPDRFAVYVATLEALVAAAASGPVLVVVDDVQWLDQASAEALRFVSRRLGYEGVGLIFAGRLEPGVFERVDIPCVSLPGLDVVAGAGVITDSSGHMAAPDVVATLVEATGGNPLALQAAASTLDMNQLLGVEPLPDPPPVGRVAAEIFHPAIAVLPRRTRRALLVAVAAGVRTEAAVLVPVLTALGLGFSDLEPAESEGLLSLGSGGVRFRHPLVRAAAYQAATPDECREAHRILAHAAPPDRLGEARAWHLAAAAPGSDGEAAAALHAVAVAQRSRGAHGAASRAFARAAGLSEDPERRAERLLEAARAARLAGTMASAVSLVQEAIPLTRSPTVRAQLQSVRAEVEATAGRLGPARDLLIAEAGRLEVFDRSAASAMLTDAALPGLCTGEVDPSVVAARQGYALARASGALGRAEWATTLALVVLGREIEAREALHRWRAATDGGHPLSDPAVDLALARVLIWVDQWGAARDLLQRFITAARGGAPGELPLALEVLADLEWRAGRWEPGLAAAAEGVELAEHMDQVLPQIRCLSMRARYEAVMGLEPDCRADLARLRTMSRGLIGEAWVACLVDCPAGLLALAAGDGASAASVLGRALDAADARGLRQPGALLHLGDLVEAELLAGRTDAAHARLATLQRRADDTSRATAQAIALRCRAMLADEPRWESDLSAAAATLGALPAPFERGRALLTLGERLRRVRRRTDARIPLRSALALFEGLGAEPWSRRARAELRATGEGVSARRGTPSAELTSQQLRVALTVAEGITNREAGARLFMSPKTVEHHLSQVFEKLGVRSRAALARRLITPAEPDERDGPAAQARDRH